MTLTAYMVGAVGKVVPRSREGGAAPEEDGVPHRQLVEEHFRTSPAKEGAVRKTVRVKNTGLAAVW